mmetsp:Transcript_15922/g.47893  ORF Transcript_15922/g.47893 Transcript_15922/m.47893 type:complete len:243 (+) Transcript_15922:52-780(+)
MNVETSIDSFAYGPISLAMALLAHGPVGSTNSAHQPLLTPTLVRAHRLVTASAVTKSLSQRVRASAVTKHSPAALGPNFKIRTATAHDVAALAAVAEQCNLDWDEPALQRECERDFGAVFVATSGVEVIAILIAWLIADEVQILEVAVVPAHRRKGIGTRLLTTLLSAKRIQDAAATTAWLEVKSGNEAAVALYNGLGFVETGLRRGYYADGSDAVMMCLDLSPPLAIHPPPQPSGDPVVRV